jgi:hypothetical protein
MAAKTALALCLFFSAVFPAGAELLFSKAIRNSPARLERLNAALETLRSHEPESPVLRWSRVPTDPGYEGDLWIGIDDLNESTLGQWNGAEIILSVETVDQAGIWELALILHHEAVHADHHYRDLEAVLINEYSSFFSPRQYLLFEMLNEALAVYRETSLRYRMSLNNMTDHKYKRKPDLARYSEDFYAFYKDLRRWMKSRGEYARLPEKEFEQALFREYITGFFADPWYLDYYMPQIEQRYIILRGKDFAVCPMICSTEFARFTGKEGTSSVINRYVEKNSPGGMVLGLDAEELEILLEKTLDSFIQAEKDSALDAGEGPGERGTLRNLETYRETQKNYEELPVRFSRLPAGIELRYNFSFAPETIKAFHGLLDALGRPGVKK